MNDRKHQKHKPRVTLEICVCGASRIFPGEWVERSSDAPQPLAQYAAKTLWKGKRKRERTEHAAKAAQARWERTTPEERSAYASRIATGPRPNRVIKDRCPCGKYSKATAAKRNHQCSSEGGKE